MEIPRPALSPRPNPAAEDLARESTGSFLAPEDVYLRVDAELTAIRQAWAMASLRFAHSLTSAALLPDFEALPGVITASTNGWVGDSADICLSIEGTDHVFIFDDAGGDCPAGCINHHYYAFRSLQSGSITQLGEWDPSTGQPAPAWFTSRPDCTRRLGNGR